MTSIVGYCSLQAAAGWAEPCSGPACAFWDAKAGACFFDDVTHELEGRPSLARLLLDLRAAFEQGDAADRARVFQLLNAALQAEASHSAGSRDKCAA